MFKKYVRLLDIPLNYYTNQAGCEDEARRVLCEIGEENTNLKMKKGKCSDSYIK